MSCAWRLVLECLFYNIALLCSVYLAKKIPIDIEHWTICNNDFIPPSNSQRHMCNYNALYQNECYLIKYNMSLAFECFV